MKFNPIKLFRWLSLLLVLITLIVSIQNYYLPGKSVNDTDDLYTEYNNYVIFKYSFFHLIDNENLYVYHDDEQFDLFKYSPTFAFFMGAFAFLPDLLGLILWNLLNIFVLLSAIRKLPFDDPKKNSLILAFIFIELITNLQNTQSNALMVGLLLWAFIFLERKKLLYATLFITLSVFIKLFGLVLFAIFIFYPNKGKAILYTLFWTLLLILLPLVLVSLPDLFLQYENWFILLKNDTSRALNLSVVGWLNAWFDISGINKLVLVVGSVMLLAPLLRTGLYKSLIYRYLFLSSVLIWMVIFNHKAESPTYIIAVMGIAIWFFIQKKTQLNIILLLFAFFFTILSHTDITPNSIRDAWVYPFVLKAVPSIIIWVKLNYDMWKISL